MAGLELSTTTYSDNSQISAVIDEWQVRFARYINRSPPTFSSSHPSLVVVQNHRLRGTWISTASAAAKLIYERSSTGLDDAVLVLSLGSRILEEHYISKLHFSWPQVSCMSGFPARGSRAVFVSYKNNVGQMEKFALQFLSIYEAEKLMNIVKDILGNGSPQLQLQCLEFNSEMSCQSEAIFSHRPAFKTEGEWQHTTSVDNFTKVTIPGSELKAAENSVLHEGIGDHKAVETMSPPSFTELMKNCHPAISEVKLEESGQDLKTQFVQYLETTSFKELLATVENVISQLGDDVLL